MSLTQKLPAMQDYMQDYIVFHGVATLVQQEVRFIIPILLTATAYRFAMWFRFSVENAFQQSRPMQIE